MGQAGVHDRVDLPRPVRRPAQPLERRQVVLPGADQIALQPVELAEPEAGERHHHRGATFLGLLQREGDVAASAGHVAGAGPRHRQPHQLLGYVVAGAQLGQHRHRLLERLDRTGEVAVHHQDPAERRQGDRHAPAVADLGEALVGVVRVAAQGVDVAVVLRDGGAHEQQDGAGPGILVRQVALDRGQGSWVSSASIAAPGPTMASIGCPVSSSTLASSSSTSRRAFLHRHVRVPGGERADAVDDQHDGPGLRVGRAGHGQRQAEPRAGLGVAALQRPVPAQRGREPQRGVRVADVGREAQGGEQVVALGSEPVDPLDLAAGRAGTARRSRRGRGSVRHGRPGCG